VCVLKQFTDMVFVWESNPYYEVLVTEVN